VQMMDPSVRRLAFEIAALRLLVVVLLVFF
jgi:hypothetical protein